MEYSLAGQDFRVADQPQEAVKAFAREAELKEQRLSDIWGAGRAWQTAGDLAQASLPDLVAHLGLDHR